jgi:hypothetical protein
VGGVPTPRPNCSCSPSASRSSCGPGVPAGAGSGDGRSSTRCHGLGLSVPAPASLVHESDFSPSCGGGTVPGATPSSAVRHAPLHPRPHADDPDRAAQARPVPRGELPGRALRSLGRPGRDPEPLQEPGRRFDPRGPRGPPRRVEAGAESIPSRSRPAKASNNLPPLLLLPAAVSFSLSPSVCHEEAG